MCTLVEKAGCLYTEPITTASHDPKQSINGYQVPSFLLEQRSPTNHRLALARSSNHPQTFDLIALFQFSVLLECNSGAVVKTYLGSLKT